MAWVYIMTNEAIPNLIKIGKTNDLDSRQRDMSRHTGVPMPYEITYKIETIKAGDVEAIVHASLHEYRIDVMREFFNIDINKAIKTIEKVVKIVEQEPEYLRKKLCNHGKLWTDDLAWKLKNEYNKCKDFKELCKIIGRTPYEMEVFLNSVGYISTTKFPRSVPGFKNFPKNYFKSDKAKEIVQQKRKEEILIYEKEVKLRAEEYLKNKNKSKKTNAGKPWLDDEKEQLVEDFFKIKTKTMKQKIKELSNVYQRTEGAIKSQLKNMSII